MLDENMLWNGAMRMRARARAGHSERGRQGACLIARRKTGRGTNMIGACSQRMDEERQADGGSAHHQLG